MMILANLENLTGHSHEERASNGLTLFGKIRIDRRIPPETLGKSMVCEGPSDYGYHLVDKKSFQLLG
jgi:hypothetical protein